MSLKFRGAACTHHTGTLEGSIDGWGFWPPCTALIFTTQLGRKWLWCFSLMNSRHKGHRLYLLHPSGEVLFKLYYLSASPKY